MENSIIPARRFDLDWLRTCAFGALILYHVGMFYVSWDWHVKSSRASEAIEPLMLLINPWRLTLLFIISGVATRFIADKMSLGALAGSRMWRLWPPLVLAVFVVVPPQSYFEIYEALQAMGVAEPAHSVWLQGFYLKYVTASGGWCDADGCLTTPTYNHMWFVAYLILYTLVLLPLIPLLRRLPPKLGVLIDGPGLILTPFLFMFVLRVTLFPIFGETHDFRVDWYLHPLYLAAFLFGFAIAKRDAFFVACTRLRFGALGVALACWAAILVFYANYDEQSTPPEWLRLIMRGAHEMQAWTAIVAAFGFAHRYLQNADGPVRRYFTEAIFPFYLAHQTIIVVVGHYLDELSLPLALEAPLLIGATAGGCVLTYEIARRSGILRPLFGLKWETKRKAAARGEAAEQAPV